MKRRLQKNSILRDRSEFSTHFLTRPDCLDGKFDFKLAEKSLKFKNFVKEFKIKLKNYKEQEVVSVIFSEKPTDAVDESESTTESVCADTKSISIGSGD